MKCLSRFDFLNLRAGVIYTKGEKWAFGGFHVKADTLYHGGKPIDFVRLGLGWVDAKSSEEAFDRLEKMAEEGASFPMDNDGFCRDGMFDDKELFLVLEPSDLRMLRERIDDALRVWEEPSS